MFVFTFFFAAIDCRKTNKQQTKKNKQKKEKRKTNGWA